MAQRRMFSPQIVESDAFLDMALSTQALYFHLGMKADDDGFVNPRSTMRSIGASEDELKVLIAKRFVLPFDNGVIVIKHWKINNLIKPDRYHPTIYEEQKALLSVKSNGGYTEKTDGFQNGSKLEPQVRLGKVSIGNTAQPAAAPFNLQEYVRTMADSEDRKIKIIAHFFALKKPDLKTLKQAQTAIRRHLRAAKELTNFDSAQIKRAMRECQEMQKEKNIDWTLETVIKVLTK